MNLDTTMHSLYLVKARFDYLAKQLEQSGHRMAAEELKREAHHFGCQLTQIESVLDEYRVDIAAVQLPIELPRFVGVDMAAVGCKRTVVQEVTA
ncbi:hypothetical protein [Halomonas sp. BL6]|uniref:hypothetical protein n=1 Tax=Halomonas sp. BL6 TaxID=2585770 RepID=UPI00111B3448|nr:hypothetical protein [Halomonas sp. BL6]TNH19981.1 hypothetical protein FHJ80_02035 [Halomonas sp. BL6]